MQKGTLEKEIYRATKTCLIVTFKLKSGASEIDYSSREKFADSIQSIYKSIVEIFNDTLGYVISDCVTIKTYRGKEDLFFQFNGKERSINYLQKKVEKEFSEK